MLFAALAFFAVGQAALTRSDAQGAADAAALAAAGDARDHLLPGLELATLGAADWERVLDGDLLSSAGSCEQARRFAERNDATVTCTQALLRFSVEVRTNGTVGQSVIPGTSDLHGQAKATAAIEPRCSLATAPNPEPTATPSPSGTAGPSASPTAPPRSRAL
ncbi:pilus assembly protein TadG-related protein [Streptomyces globosus]|uniref:pilus assembly protein TadG-related protein n=1 Tax=Streptomyces globosus TaxID=68209 RepID=UPI003632F407